MHTEQLCVIYQLATLDLTLYDASATHKIVFLLLFQLFPACSPLFLCCKKLPVLLWGPLFCGGPCLAEHAEHA